MKIINQSHEIIDRSKYTAAQLIEVCGRTCYKSEDKITDDSADKFVHMIANRAHLSVLEHGALALKVPHRIWTDFKFLDHEIIRFLNIGPDVMDRHIISGNLRTWIECLNSTDKWDHNLFSTPVSIRSIYYRLWEYCPAVFKAYFGFSAIDRDDYKDWRVASVTTVVPEYEMTDAERLLHAFKTVRFITNRGVTHELVRHRPASYSQESTRYVNYGGDDINFILPVWMADYDFKKSEMPRLSDPPAPEDYFVSSCKNDELFYKILLREGWRPEQARGGLPNDLKTEIVVTANLKEWKHIFKMRCSKAAHPQIRALMLEVYKDFQAEYPTIFKESY